MNFLQEGSRFLGASLLATGLQYALLILFVEALGLAPLPAGALAFGAGACTNYVLRRNYVFRRNTPHRQGVPRFILVAAVGVSMNGLIMMVGMEALGLAYLPAQVLATGMIFFWNFLAHRHWTFAPAGRKARQPVLIKVRTFGRAVSRRVPVRMKERAQGAG